MDTNQMFVELFTIPQAACDSYKANWIQVGEMVKNLLDKRFGKLIEFTHIEFMSEKWFDHPKASELLEIGDVNFPFVLVNNDIASTDKKINVSKVIRAIQQKLQQ